jgi:serine protease inhibitor ecotin
MYVGAYKAKKARLAAEALEKKFSMESIPVVCLRLSCCINAMNCCVNYLCLTGWIYVFYVGHIDKIMKPFSML